MNKFLRIITTGVFGLFANISGAQSNVTELSVWANEAIVATYSFSAQRYIENQKDIAHYYTADGWVAYSQALNDSKLPEAVAKNQYTVTSVATLPPLVVLVRDNLWQATMPLLVLYKNPQYQQTQNLNITIQFKAVGSGLGVRGYAITRFDAKSASAPCVCQASSGR